MVFYHLFSIPENSNYIKKLLSSEGDFNMKVLTDCAIAVF